MCFPWHLEGIEFQAALDAAERSGVLFTCGNECATGKWELVPCGIVTAVKVLGSSHAKVNLRITRIKQQNSTVSLHIFGQGKGGKLAVTPYQEEK